MFTGPAPLLATPRPRPPGLARLPFRLSLRKTLDLAEVILTAVF